MRIGNSSLQIRPSYLNIVVGKTLGVVPVCLSLSEYLSCISWSAGYPLNLHQHREVLNSIAR